MTQARALPAIADLVTRHSLQIEQGETVLLEAIDVAPEVVMAFDGAIRAAGGRTILSVKQQALMNWQAAQASVEEIQEWAQRELEMLRNCQAFLGLRAPVVPDGLPPVPEAKQRELLTHFIQPVHYQYRNRYLRWLYLRWPTEDMALRAGMTLEAFEEYYLGSLMVDYEALGRAMQPLGELLERGTHVHIRHSNGTDLRMELIPTGVYVSDGRKNLPDGEVFTAPVRESVEGLIVFNVPSWYYGRRFEEVKLRFERGRVVEAECAGETAVLNALLDTDAGARYVGEIAVGTHPGIDRPIGDILFDEKMHGSIHLALGNAYPVADNGNRSAIHWDLILDLRGPDGGELVIDGISVISQGHFAEPSFHELNHSHLLSTITQASSWRGIPKSSFLV